MSIAYAMSDLAPSPDGLVPAGAVSVSGGCGVSHEIAVDGNGKPYIECAACAPILIAGHYGWAAHPHRVPLTPDEMALRELAERDAAKHRDDLTNAAINKFMRDQATPQGASLKDTLASVDPAELVAALPAGFIEAVAAAAAAKSAPEADGDGEAPAKPKTAPRASGARKTAR